jgi:hypothetical protein
MRPETHFRSIKESHNQIDVTNQFGDRDFVLAVCTVCVSSKNVTISKSFASFVRQIMAEVHFLSMKTSHIESDVTIQFLVGRFVIHFAGIFHPSCSVQKLFKTFMVFRELRNFFKFWSKYDPETFLQISKPQKALL